MAARPYWKGYMKLSLVTCSVEMTPATSDSDKVKFHTLNRDTGNRVLSQYVARAPIAGTFELVSRSLGAGIDR